MDYSKKNYSTKKETIIDSLFFCIFFIFSI